MQSFEKGGGRKLTWLQVEILAPLHVFNQTKSGSQRISPDTGSAGTVLEVPDCFVPLPPGWEGVTLKHVAAGEAKEFLFPLLDPVRGTSGLEQRLTGLTAAKASMISTLRPFGLFLYVGGNRLIRFKSSEPPRTPCVVFVSVYCSLVSRS